MKSKIFLTNIYQHLAIVEKLRLLDDDMIEIGLIASQCLRSGGKIMFCGNGGSAADSQHLAAELIGRFVSNRRALAAVALSTDTSALTCIGNDFSYDEIFARQVSGLGRAGDVLVCLSTSGKSRNVIRAVEEGKKVGIKTIGFLGRGGGDLKTLCDFNVIVDSDITARIQECHILIGHTLCGIIEQELGLA
jgi:D-sedoheptulose 7-phosphate isomerase